MRVPGSGQTAPPRPRFRTAPCRVRRTRARDLRVHDDLGCGEKCWEYQAETAIEKPYRVPCTLFVLTVAA